MITKQQTKQNNKQNETKRSLHSCTTIHYMYQHGEEEKKTYIHVQSREKISILVLINILTVH